MKHFSQLEKLLSASTIVFFGLLLLSIIALTAKNDKISSFQSDIDYLNEVKTIYQDRIIVLDSLIQDIETDKKILDMINGHLIPVYQMVQTDMNLMNYFSANQQSYGGNE